MKKSKLKGNLKCVLILLVGFAVATYSLISRLHHKIEANSAVHDFDIVAKKIDKKETDRGIRLAQVYNKTLSPNKLADPYSEKEKKNAISEYAGMLEVKERVDHVEIPKINQDLPIYAGTSEEASQKGVGHLEGTSLPVGGKGTHVVLTTHRGLPTAKLFIDLNKMEKGDVFYTHNIKEMLAYRVIDVFIVEPSDFDKVLVVKDKDYCTLLTCTPYMINSHRLLVYAERTEYNPAAVEKDLMSQMTSRYKIYLIIPLIIIAILLWYYIKRRRRKENNEIK